jgi:hypothetical protein
MMSDTRFHSGLLLSSFFDLADGANMLLQNICLAFYGLHCIVSQEIVLSFYFNVVAVSNHLFAVI